MKISWIFLVFIGSFCGTVGSATIKESSAEKTQESYDSTEKQTEGNKQDPPRPKFFWQFHPKHSTENKFEELRKKWENMRERNWWRWMIENPKSRWHPFYPPTTTTLEPKTTTPSYEEWLTEWNREQEELECGLPDIEPRLIDLRIIGGTTAIRGSWPWMVSLKHVGQHFCGGVLIAKQWVVSSAHCMLFMPGEDKPETWEIRLGRHNPSINAIELETEQRFNISGQPIFHPSVDRFILHLRPLKNDLVLLKLDKPVTLTKYVKPICLPQKKEDPEAGTRCVITGYGKTEAYNTPVTLKQAIVPIIDYKECQKRENYTELLTPEMICAGYSYGGVDSCHMDSGGPFQCFSNERWILTGVTSWGDGGKGGCAKPLKPGVYTRITSFIEWIQTVLYEDYVDSLIDRNQSS